MRLSKVQNHRSKRVPFIGWCSVCKRTFQPLTHADLDGPAIIAYVCEKCAKEILDKPAKVSYTVTGG